MSGADTTRNRVKQLLHTLPGKRGIDIPAPIFDRIQPVAHGRATMLWGRPATPEQLQWLYDNGHHEPEQIHQAFDALPHPHAPQMSVADYSSWQKAHQVWNKERGQEKQK